MAPKMLAMVTFHNGVSMILHGFKWSGDSCDGRAAEGDKVGAAAAVAVAEPAAATARRTEREREAGNTFPQHAS